MSGDPFGVIGLGPRASAGFALFGQNASTARPISRALNLQVFSEQPPTLRLTNPYQEL